MKSNKHLSLEERIQIGILYRDKNSIREIARKLDRSPSTISRELKRPNAGKMYGWYVGSTTHKLVKQEWRNSHRRENRFLKQRNVQDFIEKYLKYGYSPAIISHLLQERFNEKVSHETLYIYIYSTKKNLFKFLLRRKIGRIRRKKISERKQYVGTGKNIPNRIDIDLRNELANQRIKFGHFEADSVLSCKQRGKTKSCLTVLVDRATRYTIIKKRFQKLHMRPPNQLLQH